MEYATGSFYEVYIEALFSIHFYGVQKVFPGKLSCICNLLGAGFLISWHKSQGIKQSI